MGNNFVIGVGSYDIPLRIDAKGLSALPAPGSRTGIINGGVATLVQQKPMVHTLAVGDVSDDIPLRIDAIGKSALAVTRPRSGSIEGGVVEPQPLAS